jgi:hypothetical protein
MDDVRVSVSGARSGRSALVRRRSPMLAMPMPVPSDACACADAL